MRYNSASPIPLPSARHDRGDLALKAMPPAAIVADQVDQLGARALHGNSLLRLPKSPRLPYLTAAVNAL